MSHRKGSSVLIVSFLIIIALGFLAYFLFFTKSNHSLVDINGFFAAPFQNMGAAGSNEMITFQLKNGAASTVTITGIGFGFTIPSIGHCEPESLPIKIQPESTYYVNLINCKNINLKDEGLDLEIILTYMLDGQEKQATGRLSRIITK